jgi:HAD superfamily hydrolase (TIGR01509 family)
MIKAVIFDFDGLIVETEVPDFQAWQEIYQRYDQRLELETWLPSIGIGPSSNPFDPLEELERRLGHPVEREQLRQQQERRYAELAALQPVAEGVEEYLREAVRLGLKLGVASSSPRQWVTGHLERLGLKPYFSCIRCGDEVRQTKPDPAVYLSVLQCLAVQPEEALALEDSPNGLRAARRAGLYCVVVPSTLTQQASFEGAHLRLRSLKERSLTEVLQLVSAARPEGS